MLTRLGQWARQRARDNVPWTNVYGLARTLLALGTAVNAPNSRGVVDMILHGLPWREGHAGPYMPAFAAALTDAQVTALATYLRARYSDRPPWQDVETTVQAARRQGGGT